MTVPTPKVQIDLVDESATFAPSAAVDGVVSWSLEDAPKSVTVALVWSTEGKGTRDSAVIATEHLDVASSVDARPFSFTLPPSPWSFSGTLISLEWAIELQIVPQRGKSIIERKPIIVSPHRVEIDLAGLDGAAEMPK